MAYRNFTETDFFAAKAGPETITLGILESHHLNKVLRLQKGDNIRVTDGIGTHFNAEIIQIKKTETTVRVIKKNNSPARRPRIDLAVGIPKLRGMETIIELISPFGVQNLFPLFTELVQNPDRIKEKVTARWQARSIAELKQNKSGRMVQIHGPLNLDLLPDKFCDYQHVFLLHGPEKSSKSIKTCLERTGNDTPESLLIISGPEGGFSPKELTKLNGKNVQIASLGENRFKAIYVPAAATCLIRGFTGSL